MHLCSCRHMLFSQPFASTITMFAVFGTVISAAFCALGIYFMGQVTARPPLARLASSWRHASLSRAPLRCLTLTLASARPRARHEPPVLRYFRRRHVCGGCPLTHGIIINMSRVCNTPPSPGRPSGHSCYIQSDEGGRHNIRNCFGRGGCERCRFNRRLRVCPFPFLHAFKLPHRRLWLRACSICCRLFRFHLYRRCGGSRFGSPDQAPPSQRVLHFRSSTTPRADVFHSVGCLRRLCIISRQRQRN